MPTTVASDSNHSAIGNRQLAIVITVSFATIIPALLWGIPSNLDLTNHFRFALPFYEAIASGDLYPGWLAESNGAYGDPSFRFYPPALYYLLASARFLFGDWYAATLVVFTLLSIASGLGMYFWTRSILPASQATWASVLYALAPYHLNQLYQATLLAEWAACAVLPFTFGFVERVCKKGKRSDVAGLAATYGLLVFTHLPLTVIGSIALLVYALAKIEGADKIRKLARLSLAAVLGLLVSAVYWLTMVSEVRWIGVNTIQPDASVNYRQNFLLSTFSTDYLNVWWMNIIGLATILLFAPAVLLFFKNNSHRVVVRPVVALVAFAVFMSLPPSGPIWSLLQPLQETQFPWRWLTLVSMGGSILAAAALPFILPGEKKSDRAKMIAFIGMMTISVAFTLSHVVREAQYFPPQRFKNMLSEVRGTPSVNYWFPIWARADIKPMASEVAIDNRTVSINSWQPEHRQFSISGGAATEARVRTFYYPHWKAMSEKGALATRPDQDGALLISIPEGVTLVNLEFREPPQTKVSTIMSLSGLIVIGAMWAPLRRGKNNA